MKNSGLFGVESSLERVLDALSTRQSVLADNVANVNTPGFKRSDVDFSQVLDRTLGERSVSLKTADPRHFSGRFGQRGFSVTKDTASTMRNDGNNVDIEREMAFLAETTVRYNSIIEYLSKHLRDIKTAASDGRR